MSDTAYYDVGYICRNGHWINTRGRDYPSRNANFCQQCGADVIHECPSCGRPIRGQLVVPNVVIMTKVDLPKFCWHCGAPYPWTESRLAAARELIDMANEMEDSDRVALKRAVADVLVDEPRTQVAAQRLRQFLKKVAPDIADALRQVLVELASSAAKQILFPHQ